MNEEESSKADWVKLPVEPLPQPTYWPAVMAVGITTAVWGLITSVLISLTGLVLMAMAVRGWIVDVGSEQHKS